MAEEETPKVTQSIATLESMNAMLATNTQPVEESKIIKPVEAVEQKLSDFVADAFKATNKDLAFNESLKAELIKRLHTLSDNQLIALFSNTAVNNNDRISKLIAPTFGLMTAEQQALLALLQKQQTTQNTSGQVGSGAEDLTQSLAGMDKDDVRDIMQGLQTVFSVSSAMSSIGSSESSNTPQADN